MSGQIYGRKTHRRKMLARCWRDRADLYKPTKGQGTSGQPTTTWPVTPTLSGIKGAMQTSWGYERIANKRPAAYVTHIFLCEVTAIAIANPDRLVINGKTYEVEVVDAASFEDIYQEVQLKEIK